jgi:acyl dehydratase
MMRADTTVCVGETSPVVEWAGDFDLWNRYAAVNDEFVPIHMDDEAGRAAGFPGAIGMGNLNVSMLHRLLRQWFGEAVEVTGMAVQFRAPSIRGRSSRATGTVTSIEDTSDTWLVTAEIHVDDDEGNRLTTGKATVRLPRS